MTQKRLRWVDVAKGILILLVVLSHFSGITKNLEINHAGVGDVKAINFLFTHYYMAAFFVLTGYTSNFKKRFSEFFVSSFKSLIIPAFCFSILYSVLLFFLFGDEKYLTDIVGIKFWYTGFKFYWFLNALFLSRICYWLLYNYVGSDVMKSFILLALMLLGIYISSSYRDFPNGATHNNPFFVLHFMRMAFFLWIGQMYRKYEDRLTYGWMALGGAICVLFTIVFKIGGIVIPSANFTINFDFSIYGVSEFLLFTITGSGLIICISKWIRKNPLLEYFGRNSLIVYVTHFWVIRYLYYYTQPVLEWSDSRILGDFYTVCVIALSYMICYFLIRLFEKRPFNVMLGKF